MAYENLKTHHEIEGVVRLNDHNKADLIAPGAAFAVVQSAARMDQTDLLTLVKSLPTQSLRDVFSAVVQPVQTLNGNVVELINPENVIAIMHQGQGGILNSKNPNFHAHVFDRTKALDHIVSKRTFVPNPAPDGVRDSRGEAATHITMDLEKDLSAFFNDATNYEIETFRHDLLSFMDHAGADNYGRVRIVIEQNKFISLLSGENLAQEGNKRWFENVANPSL